jgi:hypothetical protein
MIEIAQTEELDLSANLEKLKLPQIKTSKLG